MKKNTSVNPSVIHATQITKKSRPMLEAIHKKVNTSTVLNGGFDTLLYKIDKIEQSQSQVVTKVDKIHDAIYDPETGIFAKLAEQKHSSDVGFRDINSWKVQKEKELKEEFEAAEKSETKLVTLEKSVDTLMKAKTNVWGITKWLMIALGGGGVTLLFGWLGNWIK